MPDVVSWIRGAGAEPGTIYDAEFAEARLLTLRTRLSAAYKGVYALLLREGGVDWMTGDESSIQNYFDERVDVHHIFPQKWCNEHGIEPARCDSIVNKTPLTAKTNRSIGGKAPSLYLADIVDGPRGSDGVKRTDLDAFVRTHLVDPAYLWSDDFDSHFASRTAALLQAIREVMGKETDAETKGEPEDAPTDYELVQEDSQMSEEVSYWPPGPPRS